MITTALAFIFVLGILIFVHELGHFIVAKASGIRVERFSLGYPPKMIGWRVGETEYCISWIPFGGYVKMAGQSDVGEAESTGAPWEFGSKSPRVQASVIGAGPAMNFVLAFLIFLGFVLVGGVVVYPTTEVGYVEEASVAEAAGIRAGDRILSVGNREVMDWSDVADAFSSMKGRTCSVQIARGERLLEIVVGGQDEAQGAIGWESFGIAPFIPARVGSVIEGSPAERIGLQPGDLIVSVDGEPVGWMKMTEIIRAHPGRKVRLEWKRGTELRQAEIVPEVKSGFDLENQRVEYGRIGVGLRMARKRVGPIAAVAIAGRQTYVVTASIVDIVRGLLAGRISSKLLGGPVMIAQMAGQEARLGMERLFSFIALLSINLGLINILPIPALDGGHLLFLAAESITGRKLSPKQKGILQRIGIAVILMLMIYVTHNDILRWLQLR